MTSTAPRARWSSRFAGVLLGILLTWLAYVPAGAPDAGEVTFALSLFTIIGGFAIGAGLRAIPNPRVSLFGEAVLGLGIGAVVGFVSVFVIPSIGYY